MTGLASAGSPLPGLGELLSDEDSVRANAVMQSMLQMRKIEIAELEKAYEQAHA